MADADTQRGGEEGVAGGVEAGGSLRRPRRRPGANRWGLARPPIAKTSILRFRDHVTPT